MEDVISPSDFQGFEATGGLACCERSSLITCKAVCTAMMLDEAFWESMGGGAGRRTPGREDKHRPRVHTSFSGDTELPPPHGGRGPTSSVRRQVAGWAYRGMVPPPGLRVDLCGQQVTHSAVAVTRSPFFRGRWRCLAHARPPCQPSQPLCS